MFKNLQFFIIFPIICNAEIRINITVASNRDDVLINFNGEDNKIITDRDQVLFNVTMANLNRGMRVELGKVPDSILLKDPTPYGNLFHKYKWTEVRRNLRVERIEIDDLMTQEVVLKIHENANNSSANIFTDRSLFTKIESSVYSSWSIEGLPEEDIFYYVLVNFPNASFQYKNKWRSRNLNSFYYEFGKSDFMNAPLKSQQEVIKMLLAKENIIILNIHYKAQLTGNIIADFDSLYGKYHFYAPSVKNIMRAAGIINQVKTVEKIELKCYTDPKLVIIDKKTGVVITKPRKKLFWKLKSDKFGFNNSRKRI